MEINKNWGICELDNNEKRYKRYIYEKILDRYPFPLEAAQRLELRQFIENYILPLSITDYAVVKNMQSIREGVKVIIRTVSGIGYLDIYNNPDKENKLQYGIKMFSASNINEINVANMENNNMNILFIHLMHENILDAIVLDYMPDDKEATNFVSNLLYGVK